jgi:hypothetical protein
MTISPLNVAAHGKLTTFRGRLKLVAAVGALLAGAGVLSPISGEAATPPPFQLVTDATTLNVAPGGSSTVNVTAKRSKGFTSPIYLAASGLARGISVRAITNPLRSGSSSTALTIAVASTFVPRNTSFTLNGSSKGRTSRVVLRIVVSGSAPGAPTTTAATTTVPPVTTTTPATTIPATTTSSTTTSSTTSTIASDYTLDIDPSAISVGAGGTGTATLKIIRVGGFNQDLVATVENLPTGMTGTVDPISSTANTSTIRINVAATVTLGSYDITIKARGRVVALRVFVVAASGSASPTALTINRGTTGSALVTLNRQPTTSTISWSVENLPLGVLASFSPNGTTAVSSSMSFAVSSTAAVGAYPLNIRATIDGVSYVVGLKLTISDIGAPSATVSPTSINLAGTNLSSSVTITPGALPAGTPSLLVSGFPTGTAASSTQSGNSITYTFTIPANTPNGTYVVTLSVSQGGVTSSGTFTLIVGTGINTTSSTNAFVIATNPSAISILRGAVGVVTIPVTWNGVTPQAISFETTGGPTGMGVSYTVNPSSIGTTLNLSIPASATAGTYILNVKGTVASLGFSVAAITLTIT